MSKSEVDRHKRWEHPVPVSPFEERVMYTKKETETTTINPEDLQRLTSDVKAGNNINDSTAIGGGQRKKVPFKPFRI
ncbi:MAG: hypothetical protein AB1351_02600 [Thermoproteota archaeon]